MNEPARPRRIALIAGEASGDILGGHLMAGFRELLGPNIEFFGVGGANMEAEGLSSLFPMADLSVMGIGEVLPKLPKLMARIRLATEKIASFQPDVLVTIDSPDFCLRVAKRLKKQGASFPIAHYVAPSVWAWRPKRADKMARIVDHVLALLPFEPPYMTRAGVTCDFVGHPIAATPLVPEADALAFRGEHGIQPDKPLICLLPGSRMGELKRHGEVFAKAMEAHLVAYPEAQVVLPAAGPIAGAVADYAEALPFATTLLDPREMPAEAATQLRQRAFRAADLALGVSGTVSLELAAQKTPMVICWDAGAITRAMLKRMFQLDTATLVNLVSETRAVPELFFEQVTPENIAELLAREMSDPSRRADQVSAAGVTMERLGRGSEPGGVRAARSIVERFGLLT